MARRTPQAASFDPMLRQFIIGPENSLLSAALGLHTGAVPRLEPDHLPFFIYAGSGLGKSQLLHALAGTWSRLDAKQQVLLITAPDLARSLTHALRVGNLADQVRRYMAADVLLIDDLHRLQHRYSTQQHLSRILDHRVQLGRATILAAPVPPQRLTLEHHLLSRVWAGLAVPLKLPSESTREAVLAELADLHQIRFSPPARRWLIQHGPKTIGELGGSLQQLVATLRATPHAADELPELQLRQIQNWLATAYSSNVHAPQIIHACAKYFGLQVSNLTGDSRRKLDVLARSIAMFLIREMTGSSFQQIGDRFGRRDHSTVLHACRKIETRQVTDTATRNALQDLRHRLSTSWNQVDN